MKWAKDNNKDYQWIITFPSDTPFFKNQIMNTFLNKINTKESELFFMKSNEKRHNTGVYLVRVGGQNTTTYKTGRVIVK